MKNPTSHFEISFLEKYGGFIFLGILIIFAAVFGYAFFDLHGSNPAVLSCMNAQLGEMSRALDNYQLCSTESCRDYFSNKINTYSNINCKDLVKNGVKQ